MKRERLIAYAASFVSLLLEEAGEGIERIVLFGSVARGDFDSESDIDLFVDARKPIEPAVRKAVALFERSEARRKWAAKGVGNDLSVQVGELREWALRRDVLTDGILLYGKYQELPEGMGYYVLIQPRFARFSKAKNVTLWRKLYGYRQKVGTKRYESPGLVAQLGGARIENGVVVPVKEKRKLLEFLRKNRIPHTIREFWSDV
ncbi:MAG TPA: nucleotidyltransferase domain-containing protein [archaeon]|nr:nucleotidyltransferase domain-containing protein [archaeon]